MVVIDKRRIKTALGLWIIFLLLEAVAIFITYETIGAVASGLLFTLCLSINAACLAITIVAYRTGAFIISSLILLLIWWQLPLGVRWYYVHDEAEQIVQWVYSEETRTGAFPQGLSEYVFKRPQYQEFITYGMWSYSDEPRFAVNYYVGSQSTGHWYWSEVGWGYTDD